LKAASPSNEGATPLLAIFTKHQVHLPEAGIWRSGKGTGQCLLRAA